MDDCTTGLCDLIGHCNGRRWETGNALATESFEQTHTGDMVYSNPLVVCASLEKGLLALHPECCSVEKSNRGCAFLSNMRYTWYIQRKLSFSRGDFPRFTSCVPCPYVRHRLLLPFNSFVCSLRPGFLCAAASPFPTPKCGTPYSSDSR